MKRGRRRLALTRATGSQVVIMLRCLLLLPPILPFKKTNNNTPPLFLGPHNQLDTMPRSLSKPLPQLPPSHNSHTARQLKPPCPPPYQYQHHRPTPTSWPPCGYLLSSFPCTAMPCGHPFKCKLSLPPTPPRCVRPAWHWESSPLSSFRPHQRLPAGEARAVVGTIRPLRCQ